MHDSHTAKIYSDVLTEKLWPSYENHYTLNQSRKVLLTTCFAQWLYLWMIKFKIRGYIKNFQHFGLLWYHSVHTIYIVQNVLIPIYSRKYINKLSINFQTVSMINLFWTNIMISKNKLRSCPISKVRIKHTALWLKANHIKNYLLPRFSSERLPYEFLVWRNQNNQTLTKLWILFSTDSVHVT